MFRWLTSALILVLSLFSIAKQKDVLSKKIAVNCRDQAQESECIKELVKTSATDIFLKSILKAYEIRLGPPWKCNNVTHWTLDKSSESDILARTTLICNGKEQYLNIDLEGRVQTNKANQWTVWIQMFRERLGE